MDFEPVIAQKFPYVLKESQGSKRAWCSCGLSAKQPFCDGSHSREQTGMKPLLVTIESEGDTYWCGCKRTATPPFCDGTHKTL